MKSAKVSVVIFINNTNKELLDKSIKSVLNQSYKNIELIIVNDKSTKKETISTIEEYANKYPNIFIVNHEENYGMMRGRKTGFEKSTGDYIIYLDSADTMTLDYIRTMVDTAEKNNADLVVSSFNLEYEDGQKEYFVRCPFRNKTYDLKNEEIFNAYMAQEGHCYSWSVVWNKLYKRELVEKTVKEFEGFTMSHKDLNMTEDFAFTSSAFINAKHMVSSTGEAVNYYKHSGPNKVSASNLKTYLTAVDHISSAFGYVKALLEKHDIYPAYKHHFEEWKNLYARYYLHIKPSKKSRLEIKKILKEKFDVEEIKEFNLVEDNYFYNEKNNITQRENEKEKIVQTIINKNTKIVSFDIFETLINRQLFEPIDVFLFLNLEFNKLNKSTFIDFAEIRRLAEFSVRQETKKEEITFDDIYNYIEKHFMINHKTCEHLKQKEFELELKFMIPRQFGKKLFEIAKHTGKEVIFTSDMYLSEKMIRKLLEKCGYPEDVKLFLSCNVNKTKHTGHLFDFVLKEIKVKPSEMVHIGDNYHSDYEVPQKIGIKAFYVPNTREMFKNSIYKKLIIQNSQYLNPYVMYDNALMKSMFGLAQNKIFDNPYNGFDFETIFNGQPKYLGYFAVGMQLVALMHWLEEKVKDSKKVHFVARDGYLPMLAYQELKKYNNNLPEENYFYISRKAILLLDVYCKEDLASLFSKITITIASPKKIASYFQPEFVNYENLKKNCIKNKIPYDKNFELVQDFYDAIQLFDDKVINYKAHKEYCEKIIEHLKKIITPKNKFFDIGYSGRAESILSKVMGYPVDSLYIHTNKDTPAIRSHVSNFKIDCFMDYLPKVTGTIREHIFMKCDPSLIGYKLTNDKLQYVFEELKISQTTKTITGIVQEEAVEFVKDFYKYFYEYMNCFTFQEGYVTFPYERYLNDPIYKDKAIFSCVSFEDNLGYGENKNMLEIWETDCPAIVQQNIPSSRFAIKLVHKINKLFPVGSKRRVMAKKCYNFMIKVKRKFKKKG